MGHVRIGVLPVTEPWKKVVEKISDGADVAAVAAETLTAAGKAFLDVGQDNGFRESIFLLTELALAGGKKDSGDKLAGLGVDLVADTSVADVMVKISNELERRVSERRSRTDFGELAQNAAIGALTAHLQSKCDSFFEPTRTEMLAAFKELSKPARFGAVVRDFTAKLTNATLGYFLSKTLGTHVGANQRFPTTNQVAQFSASMERHCTESSAIVEQFAGEWFSKRRYLGKGDISREAVERFSWFGMQKMRAELEVRGK